MIKHIVAAALVLSLTPQSSPNARDELASLRQKAHAAREAGDKDARLGAVLQVQQLLNDAPGAVEVAARAYAEAGDARQALAALAEYASEGQADDALLDGKDKTFALLDGMPEYKSILQQLKRNKGHVSQAEIVFNLPDPGVVAEDIAYDARTKSFLITSVLEKKIVRVTLSGLATDFAQSPSNWPMFAIKVDAGRNLVWATEAALKDFTPAPKGDWDRSAVLCFDLRTGALLRRIEGPAHSALADLSLAQNGDPLVSDGFGGGVYRVTFGKLILINDHDFISPQTPGMLPDGKSALVPDYLRGIGMLDMESGQVSWLNQGSGIREKAVALSGIDGLYLYRNSLILTQNGTSPERVVQIQLDKTMTRVISEHIIERGTATLGDPTHGVIVDDYFYYIANSGWSELDDHGEVKSGSKLTSAHLMRFSLR